MTHWGWYWRVKRAHIPKTLTSDLTQLDSFRLFKNPISGFRVEASNLRAILCDDHFKVTYGKHKYHSYVISVEKQACNYGGFRYFFKCPCCQKRMRILYFLKGMFLCRGCLNLGYESQRLCPSRRYGHMMDKLETLLKADEDGYYYKPKWMKHSRFKQLESRYFDYEMKEEEAMRKELLMRYPKMSNYI